MHMRIISWNIRGMNNKEKRLQIKNSLKMWNDEVICFQETNMEHIRKAEVRTLWGNRFANWVFLESKGALGEIIIM
jgi:exonuclease III